MGYLPSHLFEVYRRMTNQTETSIRTGTPAVLCLASAILAVLFFMPGITAAGTISIDTSNLNSVPIGTTVQVPVIITGADELSGYQLKINTGDTDAATIKFNPASVESLDHSDKTGIILWAGFMSGEKISGDKTLFALDVTPHKTGTIDLTVDVTYTYEHVNPSERVTSYTGSGAYITASDSGAGTPVGPTVTQTSTPSSGGSTTPAQTSVPQPTQSTSETAVPTTDSATIRPTTPGATESPGAALPTTTEKPEPTKTPISVFGIFAVLTVAVLLKRKENL